MERIAYASGQVITRAIADIRSHPGNTKLGFTMYAFLNAWVRWVKILQITSCVQNQQKHFDPTGIENTTWIM